MFQQGYQFLCSKKRSAIFEGTGRVMLYPLTEIGIGMFVPIVISLRQLVMDILRHGKWRNSQQEESHADRQAAPQKAGQTSYGSTWSHCGRAK